MEYKSILPRECNNSQGFAPASPSGQTGELVELILKFDAAAKREFLCTPDNVYNLAKQGQSDKLIDIILGLDPDIQKDILSAPGVAWSLRRYGSSKYVQQLEDSFTLLYESRVKASREKLLCLENQYNRVCRELDDSIDALERVDPEMGSRMRWVKWHNGIRSEPEPKI